jgi:hypothetical protein
LQVHSIGKQRRSSSLAVLVREQGSAFRFELHDCSLGDNETTDYKVGCASEKEMKEWASILGRALAARQKSAAQKAAVEDWGADLEQHDTQGSPELFFVKCNNVFFAWESILQLETRVAELREEHALNLKEDFASERARGQLQAKMRLGLWNASEDGMFAQSVRVLERLLIALITAICNRLAAVSVQAIVERAYSPAENDARCQLAMTVLRQVQIDVHPLADVIHPSCMPLCVAGLQISVFVAFVCTHSYPTHRRNSRLSMWPGQSA